MPVALLTITLQSVHWGRRIAGVRALAALTLLIVVIAPAHATSPTPPAEVSVGAVTAAMQLTIADQQGIVLANQAMAQSLDPDVGAYAHQLGAAHAARLAMIEALLNRHGVPTSQRWEQAAASAQPAANQVLACDALADDAISRLADTPPADFDVAYQTLAQRHATAGVAMMAGRARAQGIARADRAVLTKLTIAVVARAQVHSRPASTELVVSAGRLPPLS